MLFLLLVLSLIVEARDTRLMTYNIRYDNPNDGVNAWNHRKSDVISLLRNHAPDILGIQEALPNQVTDLGNAMPEYGHVGVGRDSGNAGEATTIFFRNDRFTVIVSGTFWLSATPDVPSRGWDAALNRICTYGLFEDRQSKRRFWVFNSHFDHQGDIAKVESVRLILSKIKRLNAQDYPLLLMGDFNSTPNTAPVDLLKERMHDSRDISRSEPVGPFGTFNGFNSEQPVSSRIDYIFTDKINQVKVISHAVLEDLNNGRYPSDHLPVLAVIRL